MVPSFAFCKIFVGWNIIVATVYGLDKFLAWWFSGVTGKSDSGGIRGQRWPHRRRYWRRVSEDFLLLLLFACGPVGAWFAMEGLRHKTRKVSFRRRAIMLTVVNPLWLILYWTMKAWRENKTTRKRQAKRRYLIYLTCEENSGRRKIVSKSYWQRISKYRHWVERRQAIRSFATAISSPHSRDRWWIDWLTMCTIYTSYWRYQLWCRK